MAEVQVDGSVSSCRVCLHIETRSGALEDASNSRHVMHVAVAPITSDSNSEMPHLLENLNYLQLPVSIWYLFKHSQTLAPPVGGVGTQ